MPKFKVKIPSLASGAVANAYTSIVGVKFANTTGHRARLSQLVVSGGGNAPQDLQVSIQLRRTDNTTDGTSTAVNVNTIAKKDPDSIASNASAVGKNYTVEPTTKESGLLAGGAFNARSQLVLTWNDDDAPVWGKNQTLLIEAAPGQATAANLEVSMEWQEF